MPFEAAELGLLNIDSANARNRVKTALHQVLQLFSDTRLALAGGLGTSSIRFESQVYIYKHDWKFREGQA